MMLIIFIRSDIKDELRDLTAESVGTGIMGRMVNAVVSLCMISIHIRHQ